ncbi:hypothetical protein JTB14_033820 [Gonioctena quinquepunctata]|nr:hypothetical protein JTB14_033820 [Gonioctena quinquepunctata]
MLLPLQLMRNYRNFMTPPPWQNVSPRLLEKNIGNITNRENRHECPVCNKSYKNKRHLYRHQKEECIGVEPKFKSWNLFASQRFTCDQCGRSYKHKTNLCNHKREECGKPPSYFCPICKKGFKKKQHLQRHLTVHSDIDLSNCNIDPDSMKQLLPYLKQEQNRNEALPNMPGLPKNEMNTPTSSGNLPPLSVFPKNMLTFPMVQYPNPMYFPNRMMMSQIPQGGGIDIALSGLQTQSNSDEAKNDFVVQ